MLSKKSGGIKNIQMRTERKGQREGDTTLHTTSVHFLSFAAKWIDVKLLTAILNILVGGVWKAITTHSSSACKYWSFVERKCDACNHVVQVINKIIQVNSSHIALGSISTLNYERDWIWFDNDAPNNGYGWRAMVAGNAKMPLFHSFNMKKWAVHVICMPY